MNDDTTARYQTCDALLRAFSRLNTTPQWVCDVTSDQITWTCEFKNRNYLVELIQVDQNKFNWEAKSASIGPGNRRNFGSSNGVDRHTAEKQLAALFATKLKLS